MYLLVFLVWDKLYLPKQHVEVPTLVCLSVCLSVCLCLWITLFIYLHLHSRKQDVLLRVSYKVETEEGTQLGIVGLMLTSCSEVTLKNRVPQIPSPHVSGHSQHCETRLLLCSHRWRDWEAIPGCFLPSAVPSPELLVCTAFPNPLMQPYASWKSLFCVNRFLKVCRLLRTRSLKNDANSTVVRCKAEVWTQASHTPNGLRYILWCLRPCRGRLLTLASHNSTDPNKMPNPRGKILF